MIVEALGLLFNIESFLYMNIGLFLGMVFGAIPGLTVLLSIVIFLPFTYSLPPIPSFMFLLGMYCAGSYGGSISAVLIGTPGTPHATATMLDGYPMSMKGQGRKALHVALTASTFGGLFSAVVLLLFAPQVAALADNLGSPDYFLICLLGLTIIAGVSGKSLKKGIISGSIGLFISLIGLDPMTGTTRYIFGNINLYSGFDITICLIGLFALSEALKKGGEGNSGFKTCLKADESWKLKREDYRKIALPSLLSALIGVVVGIIPGTGASEASFFSYNNARNISKHPEEFGKGSIEGIAAAETANNAVTGATLIPLLTLGIPGDACVAVLLGALMINNLTPGPTLFLDHGATVYAILIGMIFINIFMYVQGRFLTSVFARVVRVPMQILTPLIVVFCFAGSFCVNSSIADVFIAVFFSLASYVLLKLEYPVVPVLLGLVLGDTMEENFRRSLILSGGSPKIFFESLSSLILIFISTVVVALIIREKYYSERRVRHGEKFKAEDCT